MFHYPQANVVFAVKQKSNELQSKTYEITHMIQNAILHLCVHTHTHILILLSFIDMIHFPTHYTNHNHPN